jgi:signal transduction histidine kinase
MSSSVEKLNVLVVDDELGMRLGVERILRKYSVSIDKVDTEVKFTVDQAETGEEALEKIEKNPPHILLLDYKLPGINGIEVLERLREEKKEILTIMITAYASIQTAIKATKCGAYDILTKPFSPDELKNDIDKAAEQIIISIQAQKLAEEKRQVRFQFISVLAHELKAPLNAVESYLKIIQNKELGEDLENYKQPVNRCLTRVEFMRKMIFDLLDLTRIESGRKQREVKDIDLIETARVAIDTALPEAENKGVGIKLHGPEELIFHADESEMEIILNNLISNAVKYNKEGGRVDVSLEHDKDNVVIRVADTGIGMSKEEADRLFEDFVRIKNAKTRNILGSGLGLSILKKLTKLYSGSIKVESEPEKGSTFTVILGETSEEKERELKAESNVVSP